LDAGKDYSLQQTLDEHSSSITSVKFAGRYPLSLSTIGLEYCCGPVVSLWL